MCKRSKKNSEYIYPAIVNLKIPAAIWNSQHNRSSTITFYLPKSRLRVKDPRCCSTSCGMIKTERGIDFSPAMHLHFFLNAKHVHGDCTPPLVLFLLSHDEMKRKVAMHSLQFLLLDSIKYVPRKMFVRIKVVPASHLLWYTIKNAHSFSIPFLSFLWTWYLTTTADILLPLHKTKQESLNGQLRMHHHPTDHQNGESRNASTRNYS